MGDDGPPSSWWLAAALGLLVLQAAFVGAEVAFLAARAVTVRRMTEDVGRGSRLEWILSDRGRLFSTVLVCITSLGYAAESIVTYYSDALQPYYGHYIGLAAVTLFSLVFVEAMPVTIATKAPERYALALAPLTWLTYVVLWPVVTLLSLTANGLLRLFGAIEQASPRITQDEMISLIDEAEVQEDEKSMLRRVFYFDERTVEEVMVARTDMASIAVGATVAEAASAMVDSRHSRIPVYDGTLDNVVGVAYSKDMLPRLVAGEGEVPVSQVMRAPYFVHEKRSVQDLVREFQEHHRVVAMVADEFGGVAGLVTLEDALEELVGEILDEYDVEEEAATKRIGDNTYRVRGTTGIHDVMRELAIELPEGDYETVSGLVLAELGHLAEVGEAVELPNGVRIEVTEVGRQRLRWVTVTVRPPAERASEQGDEG